MRVPETAALLPRDEAEVAARYAALMINADFAYYMVRPSGEVLSYIAPDLEVHSEPSALLHALVYALRRYPSLAKFIPSRPAIAVDCTFCAGSGTRTHLGSESRITRCFACVGLGWESVSFLSSSQAG